LFTNLSNGRYVLKVEDQFGCASEQEVDLINNDLFLIDAGADLNLQFGQAPSFVRVQSTGRIDSIVWTPFDYLNCSNCADVQISAAVSQTYFIEALNERGCVATDTLKVTVIEEDLRIYIPNVFSPNGDGVNDFFTVFSFEQSVSSIRSMRVFNRWGGLVFEAKDVPPNTLISGWDGRSKGQGVQSGVYTYLIDLELIDGRRIQRSGSVTVLF